MKNVNVRLKEEQIDFLKKISVERTGDESISTGIRLLIVDEMRKKN